ncbi:hypothetical protein LSAT2_030177 [Lamellibrachia satsuma]|nr:hypothetical protein LSAT2_030177 [Lamellibrachia satsuma]
MRLYPRGKFRFCLTLTPDAGLVVVNDRSCQTNITCLKEAVGNCVILWEAVDNCVVSVTFQPPQMRAVVTRMTTCDELVTLLTQDRIGRRTSSETLSLFEVGFSSKGNPRQMRPEQRPLALLDKNFDRGGFCLELRAVTSDWSSRASLHSVGPTGAQSTTTLLNRDIESRECQCAFRYSPRGEPAVGLARAPRPPLGRSPSAVVNHSTGRLRLSLL